ncbi:MAG: hypothetical protein Q4F49_01760 [Pseudoxanthomonas suwonensis]|nr:hypothetical protein [Pseudoxanthomonas suwonensis]
MNERFRYRIIDFTPDLTSAPGRKLEDLLNEAGADGWELVTALRDSRMEPTRLFLKKREP